MGRTYEQIEDRLGAWMQAQPVFFVATAPLAEDGLVNCSPKGNRDEFRVLDSRRVAYLEQTGSGIETVAHLRENGRIVVMFCAFDGPPRIVRLHGTGHSVVVDDPAFAETAACFPRSDGPGVRSIIVVDVQRVADSCGYGVPLMHFEGHRPTMDQWAERRGPDGVRTYWEEKNRTSLDQLEGLSLPG
jgi:hypothetical protein